MLRLLPKSSQNLACECDEVITQKIINRECECDEIITLKITIVIRSLYKRSITSVIRSLHKKFVTNLECECDEIRVGVVWFGRTADSGLWHRGGGGGTGHAHGRLL